MLKSVTELKSVTLLLLLTAPEVVCASVSMPYNATEIHHGISQLLGVSRTEVSRVKEFPDSDVCRYGASTDGTVAGIFSHEDRRQKG